MRFRNLLLATALATLATSAHAKLIVTVEDLNTSATNIFTDLDYGIAGATVIGSQGIVAFNSATSPILGTYWAGSATLSVSNYGSPGDLGVLGTASFNLNALATGDNVVINVLADEYLNPTGPPITFESVVNAATLIDASYDFIVGVGDNSGFNFLQNEIDITDQNTYSATGTFDLEAPFYIQQALRIGAVELGAELGVDMSTRAVPAPGVLALLGLGLLGLVGARRFVR